MAKTPNTYVALLRGINVGGKNIIKMTDLKACFEAIGLTSVITYIQSGNVVFKSTESNHELLTSKIEASLEKIFNNKIIVLVVTYNDLREILEHAPKDFGKDPDIYRYDVIFILEPFTPNQAIRDIETRDGVDRVYLGKKVLYFSRLIERATQSKLSKIVSLPIYKKMTIRNWNTTTKLLALMER